MAAAFSTPRLLALPLGLTFLDHQHARRRATLPAAITGILLLANVYTSIDIAINRQRGRREDNRETINEYRRQKCN